MSLPETSAFFFFLDTFLVEIVVKIGVSHIQLCVLRMSVVVLAIQYGVFQANGWLPNRMGLPQQIERCLRLMQLNESFVWLKQDHIGSVRPLKLY